MTNQSNDTQSHFNPNHVGTKPRGFGNNKGKKMQDTSGKHAQVMQTKGE
ncbi:spore protein N [Bacillus sp. SA1-12]|nr:acid-soluble spore protein N [Bacillus sp. SA1-12]KKI91890.1 spore protein N [Bacillus sp. SA1-12]